MKDFLKDQAENYYTGKDSIPDEVFDAIEEVSGKDTSIGFTDVYGKKDTHLYRMYSLDKVYSRNDVHFHDYVETPKLDGSAISILYINGRLELALTRGDGKEGRIITDKVRYLVPNSINELGKIQVTGEVVASKSIKNSRNYVAGLLNTKHISDFELKAPSLYFFAYDGVPLNTVTYSGTLDLLEYLGFKTVRQADISIFKTDGTVFRVNSNIEYNKLGFTEKFPRGAVALKDRKNEDIKETILREVRWQVGGNKVTPVAIFDPVVLDDAKVSKATLHNVGFVEELELSIGDTILVKRAGQIIPSVIGKVSC